MGSSHSTARNTHARPAVSPLGRLARFTTRYRWPVIAAWIVLTLIGGVAAGKLSTRWYQSTAIPGKPAYEGSLRTLKALGAGQRPRTSSSSIRRASTSARARRCARRWRESEGELRER